jgi:Holliday junction DNA helicase RuvA
MIGRLRGILLEAQAPELLVEVNEGVAYEVSVPMTTFYQLPAVGQSVILYTHLSIREDAHQLYGFSDTTTRLLFRTLIKISGVGPKLALAILSGMETKVFVNSVRDNDISALLALPGVGKKTANRLLMEMRDKLQDWPVGDLVGDRAELLNSDERHLEDALSALLALGYKPQDAKRAMAAVDHQGLPSAQIIKRALQQLAR